MSQIFGSILFSNSQCRYHIFDTLLDRIFFKCKYFKKAVSKNHFYNYCLNNDLKMKRKATSGTSSALSVQISKILSLQIKVSWVVDIF